MKVTTVCVALLTAHNAARGKENVEIRKREISPETIRRAFATIVFLFLLLGAAVWILSITEKDVSGHFTLKLRSRVGTQHGRVKFELQPVTEHFGKTGHHLHHAGRTYGILAFFISFYKEYKKKNYTYPQENILM